MKPSLLESKANELKLSFKPIDQGLLTAVKDQLWKDKAVEQAGFRITHPQVGDAIFVLKTKGASAKVVWNKAIDALTEQADELKKELKSLK